jgi:hypothetical protein
MNSDDADTQPAPEPAAPQGSGRTPRYTRGEGPEARRVAERLEGFDLENSEAWLGIVDQFTIGVRHFELKSVADLVCKLTGLRLDRDAQRDNRVLVKWFQENWAVIQPHLVTIHLRDEGEQMIGSDHALVVAAVRPKGGD